MPSSTPIQRVTLVGRILIIAGLTLALTYPISAFIFVNSELAVYRARLAHQIDTTLDTLERVVAEQAVIGDYATIEQMLRARVRQSGFNEIDYTDSDGNVLVATEPQPATDYPSWFRAWFDLPEKPVSRKIVVGGQSYGSVTVWLSHVTFTNQVWKTAIQQLVLGAVVGLMLFAVIAWVLKRGLAPLRVATELALSLRKGEYQCLAVSPRHAAPEIRDTIATFNDAASREAWLARFAEIISSSGAPQHKIKEVVKLLCARLDMQAAVLAYRDAADNTVIAAAYYADARAKGVNWQEYAASICGTRKALAIDSSTYKDAVLDQGAPATYIGVPTRVGAHHCAVFSLYALEEIALPRWNGEVELMELCADWIGSTLTAELQEQEIRSQKDRVETVLNNVVEGIVTLDMNGVILSTNPAMERIFDYRAHEMIGQKMCKFLPQLRWEAAGREAAAPTGAAMGNVTRQEEGRRRNGEAILIEMSLRAVHGADTPLIVGVMRDVTERLRVQEALRKSEARRRRAQEMAQLGSLEVFPQSGRTVWSSELYRILDMTTASDLKYEDFLSRVHFEDRARLDEAFQRAAQGSTAFNIEFRAVRGGGEIRYLVLSLEAPEKVSGMGTRVFGVIQDVTDRKQAEAKVHAALVEKFQAEAHSRAKTLFLANMSHELRTPLNAIIGYSEMLEEEASGQGRRSDVSDLRKIQSAGKHLLSMINEVLDLSKIEAGRIDMQIEECSVASLVESAVANVEPMAAKNQNDLRVVYVTEAGLIWTDVMKLKQVLINLLGNACKFTKQGEVVLTVGRESDDGRDWMCFTVRDSGLGMTTEQIERVFEPFVQADRNTGREFGGTGLGLAISKRFCDMMGGEITVDSVPQRGSTFMVRLPVAGPAKAQEVPAMDAAPRIVEAAAGRTGGGARADRRSRVATILVAESDPAMRELIERYLSSDGFRVVSTGKGGEVLALARQHKPFLIALDAAPGDGDGLQVLKALKADVALSAIPVVMLATNDEARSSRILGAAECLTKPIDWHALSSTAKRWARVHGQSDSEGSAGEEQVGRASIAKAG
jgi:PAS domain S-box-containing protein